MNSGWVPVCENDCIWFCDQLLVTKVVFGFAEQEKGFRCVLKRHLWTENSLSLFFLLVNDINDITKCQQLPFSVKKEWLVLIHGFTLRIILNEGFPLKRIIS